MDLLDLLNVPHQFWKFSDSLFQYSSLPASFIFAFKPWLNVCRSFSLCHLVFNIFFSFSVPLGYIVVVDLELSSSLITCSLIESNLRFTLQILLILIIPFVAYNVKVLLKIPLFLLFALSCSWCLVSMPVHNFWMWALDLCHFALGII